MEKYLKIFNYIFGECSSVNKNIQCRAVLGAVQECSFKAQQEYQASSTFKELLGLAKCISQDAIVQTHRTKTFTLLSSQLK